MIRKTPPTQKIEKVPLPPPLLKNHKDVVLLIDIFYVNGHAFLHTKSEKINFLTVEYLPTKNAATIIGSILDTKRIYNARHFEINHIKADNEFSFHELQKNVLPTKIHICKKGAHIGGAERSIRVIKERARCMCHSVPYKRYTKLMTVSLIESVIYWLNHFPSKNGVSQSLSPANIVIDRPKPNFNHKKITFGSYAMVYTRTTSTMKRRSVPAIALKESNNHGGFFFMLLHTD